MPIQESNIVFVRSQVMDDVPEGGGAATGTQVIDGLMNNVFEDVSDLDRAYGRFNLRKIFVAIRTLSTDLFGGAKSVITALPDDDAIGYTLFTTNDAFDTRSAAASKVQAYLYKGPLWNGWLSENHIAGMRAINLIQRVGTPLPPVGKTLCLVQAEGTVNEIEQYVRVTEVSYAERTFTDGNTEYTRWIVTLTLSDALRYNFTGHTVNRTDNYSYTTAARVRDTTVADATRYFGASRTAAAGGIGDMQIRASSLYSQLVPSAQSENPLLNRTMNESLAPMIASAYAAISYTETITIAPGGRLVCRCGVKPGSWSVVLGGVSAADDGRGNVVRSGATIGAIAYATGEITWSGSAPSVSGSATLSYIPAALSPQQSHSLARAVTAENRRLNWLETLRPLPAPGTLSISYMAQGNWYTVADDGNGALAGADAAHGAGTISYVTGSSQMTLAALPDVGSQIIYSWASPVHYTVRAGASSLADTAAELRFTLANAPVIPGTYAASYLVNGATVTLTDDGNGVVSGAGATGRINYASGDVVLRFTGLPDPGAEIASSYTWRDGIDLYSDATADIGPGGTFTVPGATPFRNVGTMAFVVTTTEVGPLELAGRITEDGFVRIDAGTREGDQPTVTETWFDQVVGVFDRMTGVVSLTTQININLAQWEPAAINATGPVVVHGNPGEWKLSNRNYTIQAVADIRVERDTNLFDPQAVTGEIVSIATGLSLSLLQGVGDQLVAGSILFDAAGKSWSDRDGILYVDINPATGSGLAAGAIDYATGVATLQTWPAGATLGLSLRACLSRYGTWSAIDAVFRTAAAPLKPESVTITATAMDGTALSAVADGDGNIAGTSVTGSINYEYGTGVVNFGALVAGEWVPVEVDPATIRYNAVAYSYLPLDADILGIDPVRLPSDGRVPIYRRGDVVLIMHTAWTDPITVGSGGTIDCGRTRIAWVRLVDANGDTVTENYDLDRATGIVTITNAAGMAMPLRVRHTVADLRQVTDAQINGLLTLARPLTHAFPAGETLVASCLIHGDRRARVSSVWDQQTWTSVWSDTLIGSEATATLDTIAHPITVTNEGAETERWVLRWISTTTVELIGERRGLVYAGPFTADIAPINPRTRNPDGSGGVPYLTIPVAANGGGWSNGNCVRINTIGALAPIWMTRSIRQSDEPLGDGADGCEIYCLGNIDRP